MSDSTSANQKPATPKEMIGFGLVCAAVGLYFILVGAGVLPPHGGPKNLHAPLWVVACCGAAFFLGGLALILQGAGKANPQGELPADAPRWLRVAQYLIGVAIFASLALTGTWIAFGGEAPQFSASFGGITGGPGAGLGRVVFGLGALVVWIATIGFAVSGARKLFGAPKS
jgi:hypothetical protein